MKKTISILLLIGLLSLVSCGKVLPAEDKIAVGQKCIVYNDFIYYVDAATAIIRYQVFENIQPNGIPLAGDILAGDTDNPLAGVSLMTLLLVDEAATRANDDYPVIVISLQQTGEDFYKILTFNTKNNSVSILKEGLGPIEYLYLYGEYILYTTNDGELGRNVHSLKKDGSVSYTLPNPEHQNYVVKNCYNDEIYIESSPSLYKASMTMENLTLLFDNYDTPVFFFKDDLYYRELESGKLSRKPLSNLSQNEIIIDDFTVGITRGNSYLYVKKLEDGSGIDGNSIYLYNASTDENRLIFQNTEPDVMYFYMDFSDQYVLFECNYISGDKVGVKEFMVYNIETQEKLYIPY